MTPGPSYDLDPGLTFRPNRKAIHMLEHSTRKMSADDWETAVENDLAAAGWVVNRLGDAIPKEVRQAVAGTSAYSVRYTADFLIRRDCTVMYVDAKYSGDVHFWRDKTPPHRHMVGRDAHEHYLRTSRFEGIPFMYAFPCGYLCGYSGPEGQRFPHPGYMSVETFDRLRTAASADSDPLEILHSGDICLPTPDAAHRYHAGTAIRHDQYVN